MLIYKWLNTEKNRFYNITMKKDGDKIVLNHKWGSCVSNRGGKKDILVESETEAKKTIEQMIKRRKSRGYDLIAPKLH